jgi:hypothetical protein
MIVRRSAQASSIKLHTISSFNSWDNLQLNLLPLKDPGRALEG